MTHFVAHCSRGRQLLSVAVAALLLHACCLESNVRYAFMLSEWLPLMPFVPSQGGVLVGRCPSCPIFHSV